MSNVAPACKRLVYLYCMHLLLSGSHPGMLPAGYLHANEKCSCNYSCRSQSMRLRHALDCVLTDEEEQWSHSSMPLWGQSGREHLPSGFAGTMCLAYRSLVSMGSSSSVTLWSPLSRHSCDRCALCHHHKA